MKKLGKGRTGEIGVRKDRLFQNAPYGVSFGTASYPLEKIG
jgi:hypothetical protein